MASDLETYKRERTPVRRMVTTSMNAVEKTLLSRGAPDFSTVLRGHLSVLKNKLQSLEEFDTKIAALTEVDEDLEKESKESNKYQMDVYMCISKIEDALTVSQSKSSSGSEMGRGNVQLPKVNIEQFDGEATSFPAFI